MFKYVYISYTILGLRKTVLVVIICVVFKGIAVLYLHHCRKLFVLYYVVYRCLCIVRNDPNLDNFVALSLTQSAYV